MSGPPRVAQPIWLEPEPTSSATGPGCSRSSTSSAWPEAGDRGLWPFLPRNSARHSTGGGRLILPTLPSSGWVWALGHVSWAAPQDCRDNAKAGPQGGCVWEGASRSINTVH